MSRRVLLAGFALVLALLGLAPSAGSAQAGVTPLVGTFRLDSGACGGAVSGSYFRMILPTGGPGGPYVSNSDSACGDKTFTLLEPGTDGGLVTGGYQPAPSPGFDSSGNSLAARVIRPTAFFGVRFSASTEPTDLQTGTAVPAPTIEVDGAGQLTGNLAAFGATWNDQTFNQGSPKPDGSRPGNTGGPAGTYDAPTGAAAAADSDTGAPSAAAGAPTDVAPGETTVPADSATAAQEAATASATAAGTPSSGLEIVDAGWNAPTWLVLLTAGLGIGAVIVLVVLDRTKAPA